MAYCWDNEGTEMAGAGMGWRRGVAMWRMGRGRGKRLGGVGIKIVPVSLTIFFVRRHNAIKYASMTQGWKITARRPHSALQAVLRDPVACDKIVQYFSVLWIFNTYSKPILSWYTVGLHALCVTHRCPCHFTHLNAYCISQSDPNVMYSCYFK